MSRTSSAAAATAPATTKPPATAAATPGLNIAVLRGRLSRNPALRTLPSGTALTSLEVTVAVADGPDQSVPVAWFDAPERAGRLEAGDEVVVVGRVRRRFFRAGGATASRTEVLAAQVLPAGRRRAVARALQAVADTLGATA